MTRRNLGPMADGRRFDGTRGGERRAAHASAAHASLLGQGLPRRSSPSPSCPWGGLEPLAAPCHRRRRPAVAGFEYEVRGGSPEQSLLRHQAWLASVMGLDVGGT